MMSSDGWDSHNRIEPGSESDKVVFDRDFAAMERRLTLDDPEFVRRLRRLERDEAVHAVVVGVLLAASAVLLVVGMAVLSWVSWVAGVVAFVGAFAVDGCQYRKRGHVRDRDR